jgi:hypothetical protein
LDGIPLALADTDPSAPLAFLSLKELIMPTLAAAVESKGNTSCGGSGGGGDHKKQKEEEVAAAAMRDLAVARLVRALTAVSEGRLPAGCTGRGAAGTLFSSDNDNAVSSSNSSGGRGGGGGGGVTQQQQQQQQEVALSAAAVRALLVVTAAKASETAYPLPRSLAQARKELGVLKGSVGRAPAAGIRMADGLEQPPPPDANARAKARLLEVVESSSNSNINSSSSSSSNSTSKVFSFALQRSVTMGELVMGFAQASGSASKGALFDNKTNAVAAAAVGGANKREAALLDQAKSREDRAKTREHAEKAGPLVRRLALHLGLVVVKHSSSWLATALGKGWALGLASCYLPSVPDDDPGVFVRALAVKERLQWYTCPRGSVS